MGMTDYTNMIRSAAAAYGEDPGELYGVAKLESGFNPTIKNTTDSNARAGHPSVGIVQYIPSTFQSHMNAAIKANPAAWRGVSHEITNPMAQLLAASWGMTHGKGHAWTTYGRAQAYRGKPGGAVGADAPAPVAPVAGGGDPIADMIIARHSNISPIVLSMLAQDTPAPAIPSPTTQPAASGEPTANGWKQLQHLGQSLFGLRNDPGNSQTTGGHHTNGSEHYSGRAIDFGNARNSAAKLAAWKAWALAHGYDAIDEGDHVHVSLPGGGT